MTNKEAIEWLKALKANEILSATKEALDIAIKSLKGKDTDIPEEDRDMIDTEALNHAIAVLRDDNIEDIDLAGENDENLR